MTNLDIETFWAVVQHGTMTAAAEALYITQPTLSMRIRALEERVGTPLFVRGKGQRRIQLTAAGQKFLTLARRCERGEVRPHRQRTRIRCLLSAVQVKSVRG